MKNSVVLFIQLSLFILSCTAQQTVRSTCVQHSDCNSGFCLEGMCQGIGTDEDSESDYSNDQAGVETSESDMSVQNGDVNNNLSYLKIDHNTASRAFIIIFIPYLRYSSGKT